MQQTATTSGTGRAATDVSRDEVSVYTASFGLSLGITSLLSALLVILKETNEDTVLAWMKAATGHHWVTHGIIDLVLFVALGYLLVGPARSWAQQPNRLIAWVVGSVVVSGLLIAGFYI